MTATLALAGWLVGVAGVGAAGIAHLRLNRHIEAVARACHELRGPLVAIQLGLELAVRLRQLPRQRLRGIELELGRAAIALEDLAAARRASAGVRPLTGRSLHLEPVDLAQLVADSVEAWRGPAAAHGVKLQLICPPEALIVSGERLRLAQAIGNLLANALEHGGGDVVVSLHAEQPVVRLEVLDGGPGLPAPIAQLRGWRGRRGERRRAERGRGLTLASDIAAAHGGRLAAAPSLRGARLVLELPYDVPVAAEMAASQA